MAALPFSESFKNVIATTRLIALDLGCDYISTIHFFLADCQLHPLSSLKGLFFKNEADFNGFIKSAELVRPFLPWALAAYCYSPKQTLHCAARSE